MHDEKKTGDEDTPACNPVVSWDVCCSMQTFL